MLISNQSQKLFCCIAVENGSTYFWFCQAIFFTQNVYVMELVIALLMWMGAIVSPDAGADLVQDDHHYIIEEYQAAAPSSAIVPDPDEL